MADEKDLEGQLTAAAKERSMEREKKEELGRFVQSACQLAEQPNLKDGFYTSPEEAHSKHHLDMGDIERTCAGRADVVLLQSLKNSKNPR